MIQEKQRREWNRYRWIELGFFAFIWLIIPLVSDLEYALKEEPNLFHGQKYSVTVIRRLVWGVLAVWPYFLFYRLSIQRWLIRKKYWQFVVSIPVFCVLLELYTIYAFYWPISRMSFLPEEMVSEARKWMPGWSHFTISYLLLQILEMAALAYFIHYEKLKTLKTEMDLKYLRGQLQPHFFFNTLNNIYSLALQQSPKTAPMVSRLSDMMRYVLYESSKTKLRLHDELAFLADYIEVQSVRYNDRVRIRLDTQGILEETLIEPLLILPFVENAFKHGIEEELGCGYVDILLCQEEQELTVSVKNSRSSSAGGMTGIGVDNVRQRLELLYPGRHMLEIRQGEREYVVILTLTLS